MHAQSSRRHGMSWLNFGAWLGRISFVRGSFGKWFQGFSLEQLDVKLVNRILGSLVGLLAIYFVANLFVSLIGLSKLPRWKAQLSVTARSFTGGKFRQC